MIMPSFTELMTFPPRSATPTMGLLENGCPPKEFPTDRSKTNLYGTPVDTAKLPESV